MTDLIWIGNTLYPRWVEFVGIAAVGLLFVILVAFPPRRS